MKYRQLPHGNEREKFSELGLGLGGIQESGDEEIEAVIRKAMDNGINYFDLCAGGANVYAPFGRAIKGRREDVFFQMHFGATYNEKGEYAWSRDFNTIKQTIEWEMKTVGTSYIDMGFLHCVDELDDFLELESIGVFDFVRRLKRDGIIRHIGFSSHTPSVAQKILDTKICDMMMFSINAAYDFEKGDEYGIGSVSERSGLFRRCAAEGVGISVMKPFHGGKLLDGKTSPFKTEMTKYQCIQYALDRPGVLSVLPGVRNMRDLDELLGFSLSTEDERDYSVISSFTPVSANGNCVYCNHCQPCPAHIDVALVNKYYDLAKAGDKMAQNHYSKLSVNAENCLHCNHCDKRCPFEVEQSDRMTEIARYFKAVK